MAAKPKTKRPYPHLATRVLNTPLLIERGKAEIILGVLAPRLGLSIPDAVADMDFGDEGRTGHDAIAQPGLAIIPVHGTLVQRGDWMDALSGLSSYESLCEQFDAALADDTCLGIVFDFDSPGGEVAGCADFADHIYEARGGKPIWAVSNEAAYSAAYWLASACDRIWLTRTAGVGSIGVIAQHAEFSKAEQLAGIKVTPVFAGARKNDFSPHEPLSKDARAVLQAEIDRIYDIFGGAVARNRALSVEAVKNTEAGLYFGPDALTAGLADSVGTLGDAVAAMLAEVDPLKSKLEVPMTNRVTTTAPSKATTTTPAPAKTAEEQQQEDDAKKGKSTGAEGDDKDKGAKGKKSGDPETDDENKDMKATAAEIADLCASAGVPAAAGQFIRDGLTVAQVKERLAQGDEIKRAVKAAHRISSAIALSKADEFIRAGTSLKDVKAALWDAVVSAQGPELNPTRAQTPASASKAEAEAGWDKAAAKYGAKK